MSGIGAVVKVVGSHLCGCCSISGKNSSFLIVSLSKGLSLCFMCSHQHVKYRMRHGFPLTPRLAVCYWITTSNNTYIHARTHTHTHARTHARTHTYIHTYIQLQLYINHLLLKKQCSLFFFVIVWNKTL